MIRELILAQQYALLAKHLRTRFELHHVPLKKIAEVIDHSLVGGTRVNLHGVGPNQPWSDGSWLSWFKNRFMFSGFFKSPPSAMKEEDDFDGVFKTELNVFFLHLEETPEMMKRLAEPELMKKQSKPARHLLENIQTSLKPINKTAYRVAPPPAN